MLQRYLVWPGGVEFIAIGADVLRLSPLFIDLYFNIFNINFHITFFQGGGGRLFCPTLYVRQWYCVCAKYLVCLPLYFYGPQICH